MLDDDAGERDGARDFSSGNVDGGGVFTLSVESEDAFREWIVHNGVRGVADFDASDLVEVFQVKDSNYKYVGAAPQT